MKKKLFIVIAAAMILMMLGACSGGSEGGEISEGNEAPDFSVELTNGETFSLSEHKDEVVLLNFWATWCGYCVDEMPDLQKIYDDNIDGLKMVMVNCAETKQEVDDFLKENGFTFDTAYDEDGDVSLQYGAYAIPRTVIIKDGVIQKLYEGKPADPYSEYKGAVEECMK